MSLPRIYRLLLKHWGRQDWWPAETPFEVMVGAVLTQNTAWLNVEKSINNIKAKNLLSPRKLIRLSDDELAKIIRPSGFFNLKAKRLKNFLTFFGKFNFDIVRMEKADSLRESLLKVNGIGKETADSILLYALKTPYFVIDAYTRRIFYRLGIIPNQKISYDEMQSIFHDNLPPDPGLFNEYHALIVVTAKKYCKKTPVCEGCPLGKMCKSCS